MDLALKRGKEFIDFMEAGSMFWWTGWNCILKRLLLCLRYLTIFFRKTCGVSKFNILKHPPPPSPHYPWSSFQLHTLYESWDLRKGVYTSIPSTNNVYKQSSTHKRLMEDFHFCAVFVNATCTEFSKPFKTVVRRCSEVAWPATLVKRRLLHRCFYVNFYEFLRAPDL